MLDDCQRGDETRAEATATSRLRSSPDANNSSVDGEAERRDVADSVDKEAEGLDIVLQGPVLGPLKD